MIFAGIGLAARLSDVRGIVELDCGNDAGVGIPDQEIERELVESIEDRSSSVTALEIDDLQQLHLGQDNMIWQGLHESLVKRAFALGQQLPLRLERPGFRE